MKTPLPFPHEDRIICELSKHNHHFRKHYLADVKIKRKYICSYCNKKAKTDFHHIIPRRNLGEHSANNMIELCAMHHREAENGIIKIMGGVKFKWAMKKHQKLMRKFAMSNTKENDFFKNHLFHDFMIKEFIRLNLQNRLSFYMKLIKQDNKDYMKKSLEKTPKATYNLDYMKFNLMGDVR